jgi:hypothetical protein
MADTLKWLWGMNYYQARSRLWKQAAKKWRAKWLTGDRYIDIYNDKLREAESTATRRKELLRQIHYVIENEEMTCPVCGILCCSDDCTLAEEITDGNDN